MAYLRLRRNKFLTRLLEGAKHMWNNEISSLTLSQILWRQENRNDLIGSIGKRSLFRTIPVFLLKREDGGYVLFAPSSKKDDIPCYLYDILDIQEFVKRYPMTPLMLEEDEYDTAEVYEEFNRIKDKPTRGFIETELNEETKIYEIV